MNNRILKFRIWNLEEKRWSNPNILEVFGDSDNDITGELLPIYQGDEERTLYIVQQFTELKDANGREIYEGDIVEVDRFFVRPCVVVGMLDYKTTEGEKEVGEIVIFYNGNLGVSYEWKRSDDTDDKIINHRTKVIDNIFENPELITKK